MQTGHREGLAPGDWAADEVRLAQLGDARRNRRLRTLVSDLAAQPQASIPQASGNLAAAKGAYRFLASEHVRAQSVRDAHESRTVERGVEAAQPAFGWQRVVLVAQDTSEYNFSTRTATRGLGPLSNRKAQGLLVHSALAISLQGLPLGVLHQRVWARDSEQTGKAKQRKQRQIQDKESAKWQQTERQALDTLPEDVAVVSISDRESDIYEYFAAERRARAHLLVRATQDRCLQGEVACLWETVRASPCVGESIIEVGRSGVRPPRQARVSLRFCPVTIEPPLNRKDRASLPRVPLVALLVEEVHAPDGAEALCWLLLTTLPVQTPEEAWQCVLFYCYRWLIERYHFVLKSGCHLEQLQLEEAERLEKALAVYSMVAWRLLHLTYLARQQPQAPASLALSEPEWQALYAYVHKSALVPNEPPSLRQAMRWIGRLGGFLGRARDGDPGVKVLWRGMQRLTDIVATWLIFRPASLPDVGNA